MALSEIEKLERRYAENPQGLTFAPLAEVHRKNGDVPRALDLLRPGLELHPNYVPASIVLGRCHLDLGDLPAAETAFNHVLALDEENVIALKALADITERLFRFDDAERWLQRLLSVDRSNDDARDQLQRVEASRRQAETASAVNPDSVTAAADEVAPEVAPVEIEPAEATPATVDDIPTSPPPPPLFDLPASASALEERLEPPEEPAPVWRPDRDATEVEEPGFFEDTVEPLAGLVGRDVDTPDLNPPDLGLGEDFAVETSEDIVLRSSGAVEFQEPDASQDLFGRVREPDPLVGHAHPAAPAAEVSPFQGFAPVEPEPESAAPEVAPAEAASAEREPAEAASAEREQSLAAPYVRPGRVYAARDTHGQSVAEFFRDLLAARPPALASDYTARPASTPAASPDSGGAPTRPAADALSLSSVFGEEHAGSPPAVPAAGTQDGGGVSFDEFFGGPGSSATPRPPRAPDPKNDDLDQFHTWLQNLKR
ncbi:MAG: tetratricopeptide repeat protein [Gemmatimonadales bacterium]